MLGRDEQLEIFPHATGWEFHPSASMVMLRRALFIEGDTFFFTRVDKQLSLRVEGENALVLGAELLLTWDAAAGAFVATAYGREMSFWVDGTGASDWQMRYEATYDAPPHHAPDEGGDGDPK
jgi:hypothetical protein